MSGEAARSPRRYSSKRREQQAAETRVAVLTAAAELFGERGWAATGMRDVARRAGVAVETVYANFRSKGDLLLAAVDVGVVGDDAPVALSDRPEFAALAVGDRAQRAAAAGRLMAGIQRRTAGVHHALREAAASDAILSGRLRENEERRRVNVEQGLCLVAGRPVTDRERDGFWAVLSIEVYRLLIDQAGWTDDQYGAWVADLVLRLLDDTSP